MPSAIAEGPSGSVRRPITPTCGCIRRRPLFHREKKRKKTISARGEARLADTEAELDQAAPCQAPQRPLPYVVMALCSHGPTQVGYIVLALYSYGARRDFALYRPQHGAAQALHEQSESLERAITI